jgi:hypothetical protein
LIRGRSGSDSSNFFVSKNIENQRTNLTRNAGATDLIRAGVLEDQRAFGKLANRKQTTLTRFRRTD